MWRKSRYLLAAGMGAALSYFLDPDRGRRRRNMARERGVATLRRTALLLERKAQHMASTAQGLAEKAVRSRNEGWPPPDDATLAHKVESEIFRDPDVPKGKININAENGVVVLRGQLEHPEDINTLERKVQHIAGVYEVKNLLHLPNTLNSGSIQR